MQNLWNASDEIRSLKSLILFGLRGMAVYAYRAAALGYSDADINDFFYRTLYSVGCDYLEAKDLRAIAMEIGEMNMKCVELLNKTAPT